MKVTTGKVAVGVVVVGGIYIWYKGNKAIKAVKETHQAVVKSKPVTSLADRIFGTLDIMFGTEQEKKNAKELLRMRNKGEWS